MNPYITNQLINMQASVKGFQQAAHWAAKSDDKRVSREEKKRLQGWIVL